MPHVETSPLELYYAPTPNGWKLSIFMHEAGLNFKLIPLNLAKGDQHKVRIHSSHKTNYFLFIHHGQSSRITAVILPRRNHS